MRKPKRKGRTIADLTLSDLSRIKVLKAGGQTCTALSKQFRIPIYEVLKIVR